MNIILKSTRDAEQAMAIVEGLVKDAGITSPQGENEKADDIVTAFRILEKLDPRSQTVIKLYMGFRDGKPYTFEDIGKIIGPISRQAVENRYKLAMEILHNEGLELKRKNRGY